MRKIKTYRCRDGMCGALDCTNCYPFQDEAYRKWFLRNMHGDDMPEEDPRELEADREKD